jgi:VanZ family protein
VQVAVLYSPSSHGEPLFPQADKVVHVLVFLVPVAVALLAGLRPTAVVALFAAQAVVSEVVQGTLLPARSGDAIDVVADLVGIALGVAVWRLVEERTQGGSPKRTGAPTRTGP